ncbi:MAG: hypothetical protein IAI48_14990, partial [Candidatus Eremiobacteraeota bacterium]|nr:hypothetical protein [Candidatus Eremiobacteraeota bacterium]
GGVSARKGSGSVTFVLDALQDVAGEMAAAAFKADLFERTFGLAVSFEATVRADVPSFDDQPSTPGEIEALG